MNIPKTMKAAILVEQRKPLLVVDISMPNNLVYGQVLVKIHYSGICGSQIGEIDGVKGEDKYLPHLLGHEGSGTVLKVGNGVTHVQEGDTVILHWRKGNGVNSATPIYSYKGSQVNAGWVTTFNNYAVVSENRMTKIDDGFDLVTAPLLGCALTTGFGVIQNDAKLKIGDSVVIFGSGGVGLSMIQAAKLRGAYPVIAVDRFEGRLSLAKEHGADFIINTSNEKNIKFALTRLLKNPLNVFIDNTGVPEVMELGYEMVGEQGKVVLVGVPKHDARLSIHTLPLHYGKVIIGSEGGSTSPSSDIPKLLNLIKYNQLKIDSQITKVCSLIDINDAMTDMKSGHVNGRIIVSLDG
jgi:S-(hydroxymethyl)glutathione dehydrogenase / alcohol dehydrogenase